MEWRSIDEPTDCNKITKIDISYKNLTALPDWICKCNNLQKLYCWNNKITQLPNNLPNSLQLFDCSYNKIIQIPNNLPNSLQIFGCYHNKITQIPNNLPNSLKEFWCYHNKITYIPNTLPNYLQEFNCRHNQITQIPTSIIQLRYLTKFYCCGNPIEYTPPVVSNFLNNLRNTLGINVYNDTQSVHNHNIQESIKQSIYNVLKDKYTDDITSTINEILNDNIINETSKGALLEYLNDQSKHGVLNITFKDLLVPIWQRIQKHPHKDEIKKILNIEIKDGLYKCYTGRLSRLVNCLNGFCDDISIRIGTNEQIGNVVIMTQQLLEKENRYTVELHKELVRKELKEMDYEDAIINEWLEYI